MLGEVPCSLVSRAVAKGGEAEKDTAREPEPEHHQGFPALLSSSPPARGVDGRSSFDGSSESRFTITRRRDRTLTLASIPDPGAAAPAERIEMSVVVF